MTEVVENFLQLILSQKLELGRSKTNANSLQSTNLILKDRVEKLKKEAQSVNEQTQKDLKVLKAKALSIQREATACGDLLKTKDVKIQQLSDENEQLSNKFELKERQNVTSINSLKTSKNVKLEELEKYTQELLDEIKRCRDTLLLAKSEPVPSNLGSFSLLLFEKYAKTFQSRKGAEILKELQIKSYA